MLNEHSFSCENGIQNRHEKQQQNNLYCTNQVDNGLHKLPNILISYTYFNSIILDQNVSFATKGTTHVINANQVKRIRRHIHTHTKVFILTLNRESRRVNRNARRFLAINLLQFEFLYIVIVELSM